MDVVGGTSPGLDLPPTTITTPQLWHKYKTLTGKIIDLRGELAELQMRELEGKVKTIAGSSESTSTAREQEARIPVLNLSTDIISLKAEIAGLEDLRLYLRDAIEHGVEV